LFHDGIGVVHFFLSGNFYPWKELIDTKRKRSSIDDYDIYGSKPIKRKFCEEEL
jgi:hypothetical protein